MNRTNHRSIIILNIDVYQPLIKRTKQIKQSTPTNETNRQTNKIVTETFERLTADDLDVLKTIK